MRFYPRNNTPLVVASHKLATLKFSFSPSLCQTSLLRPCRHPRSPPPYPSVPRLISRRRTRVTRWSERAAPPLAATPYEVRPDETINSIRQKRAPGTSVHADGAPRHRSVAPPTRRKVACATTPLRALLLSLSLSFNSSPSNPFCGSWDAE